jgi:hypothetical protein
MFVQQQKSDDEQLTAIVQQRISIDEQNTLLATWQLIVHVCINDCHYA